MSPTIAALIAYPECEADADLDLDGDACPECEGEGEVVADHGRYGARLVPCPAWCATAHQLYDDRGDHDRGKE